MPLLYSRVADTVCVPLGRAVDQRLQGKVNEIGCAYDLKDGEGYGRCLEYNGDAQRNQRGVHNESRAQT